VLQVFDRHAVVIMLQIAGRFPDQRESLLRLHRLTGIPIFNGDGSFNIKRPRLSKLAAFPNRIGAVVIDHTFSMSVSRANAFCLIPTKHDQWIGLR